MEENVLSLDGGKLTRFEKTLYDAGYVVERSSETTLSAGDAGFLFLLAEVRDGVLELSYEMNADVYDVSQTTLLAAGFSPVKVVGPHYVTRGVIFTGSDAYSAFREDRSEIL